MAPDVSTETGTKNVAFCERSVFGPLPGFGLTRRFARGDVSGAKGVGAGGIPHETYRPKTKR